jgi:hypothetical protein
MNRGWIVGGALILAAVPAVPAAANGVSMVLEQVGGPDGVLKWIRTGDVLRYRVRLQGMGDEARLAVAATPAGALTTVTCEPARGGAVPGPGEGLRAAPEGQAGAGGAFMLPVAPGRPVGTASASGERAVGARALARGALAGGVAAATPGAQVCSLGELAGKRVVDVLLTVPDAAREVEVAAVARVREHDGGKLTTIARTARTTVSIGPVPRSASIFSGPATRLAAESQEAGAAHPGETPAAVRPPATGATPPRRTKTATDVQAPQRAETGTGVQPPRKAGTRTGAEPPRKAGTVMGATAPRRADVGSGVTPPRVRLPGWGGERVKLPEAAGVAPPAPAAPSVAVPPLGARAVAAEDDGQPLVEAPLPREVGTPRAKVAAEETVNPLAGPRGVPGVAVGIAALMAGLWVIARTQQARTWRKLP